MSSSTSTVVTMESLKTLLELQSRKIDALTDMLKSLSAPSASAPAPEKEKKQRKKKASSAAEDGEPKQKRPANIWIVFTQRVERVVRAVEAAAGTPKEARMHTMTVKMFASYLKGVKPYDEWTDETITEALSDWTPPELSKQAVARREKAASEAGSETGSVVSSASGEEKPKRKWSEEAKQAAAAKRAATKAAKAAAPAAAAEPAPAAAEPAAPAKPAKKAAKKVAAEEPKVDLRFRKWEHKGTTYFRNGRGYVITEDMGWFGLWDGKTINEAVPEPADLDSFEIVDNE